MAWGPRRSSSLSTDATWPPHPAGRPYVLRVNPPAPKRTTHIRKRGAMYGAVYRARIKILNVCVMRGTFSFFGVEGTIFQHVHVHISEHSC